MSDQDCRRLLLQCLDLPPDASDEDIRIFQHFNLKALAARLGRLEDLQAEAQFKDGAEVFRRLGVSKEAYLKHNAIA